MRESSRACLSRNTHSKRDCVFFRRLRSESVCERSENQLGEKKQQRNAVSCPTENLRRLVPKQRCAKLLCSVQRGVGRTRVFGVLASRRDDTPAHGVITVGSLLGSRDRRGRSVEGTRHLFSCPPSSVGARLSSTRGERCRSWRHSSSFDQADQQRLLAAGHSSNSQAGGGVEKRDGASRSSARRVPCAARVEASST